MRGPFCNVPVVLQGERSDLIAKSANLFARCFVAVDAVQTIIAQESRQVEPCVGVSFGGVDGAQGVVDAAVEGELGVGSSDAAGFDLGGIADLFDGGRGVKQARAKSRRAKGTVGFVVGRESVCYGVDAAYGKDGFFL